MNAFGEESVPRVLLERETSSVALGHPFVIVILPLGRDRLYIKLLHSREYVALEDLLGRKHVRSKVSDEVHRVIDVTIHALDHLELDVVGDGVHVVGQEVIVSQ